MTKRKAAKLGRPAIEIQVRVEIRPGPVSPAMRHAWVTLWKRLISDCKRELEADEREDKRGR